MIKITVRDLIAQLNELPEPMKDLPVFSTCDWDFVSGVEPGIQSHFDRDCVEVS